MKLFEWAELAYLQLAVQWYEWRQQRVVKSLFYHDSHFRALDQKIKQGPNPYRIPEAFPYGETPLIALKQIADRCGLSKDDYFIDLGCGRGRGLFFLAHYTGCRALGVDKVSSFIDRAAQIAREFQTPAVSFSCGDLRDVDLSEATFVFLYGTAFDEPFVHQITQTLHKLPKASKIVTVSYPLEAFTLQDQFSVSFPWGEGEVFLHAT